jgi:WD40 repeat protein
MSRTDLFPLPQAPAGSRRGPRESNALRSFWCFISYRHADNKQLGRQWATWLHQAIETYDVPADLVGTVNARGETIPARIFPVFRDEEELPVDADLTASITHALEHSKYLVVVCSPRAVESTYVRQEIERFQQLGNSDRILPAIIAGEPNASRDPGKQADGISPEQECFPEPLRHREGSVEPIAADFRLDDGGEGWTSPEAYRQALSADSRLTAAQKSERAESYRKRCETMKLKIIAGILGVALGTLTKRDTAYQLALARKRARVRNVVLAVVSVLAFSAFVSLLISLKEHREIARDLAYSRLMLAQSELQQAESLIEQQRVSDSLPYLAASLRTRATGNPAAALAFSYLPRYSHLLKALDRTPGATAAQFDPKGGRVALNLTDGTARIWDLSSNQFVVRPLQPRKSDYREETTQNFQINIDPTIGRVWQSDVFDRESISLPHAASVTQVLFSPDGLHVATASDDATAGIWDIRTGKRLFTLQHDAGVSILNFRADGKQIVTASADHTARVWDALDGRTLARLNTEGAVSSISLSHDGRKIATASGSVARIWDIDTGRAVGRPLSSPAQIISADFSLDDSALVSTSADGSIITWNAQTGTKQGGFRVTTEGGLTSAAFFNRQKMVAIASNGTADLVDVLKNTAAQRIAESHQTIYLQRDFSAGAQLVSATEADLQKWNAESGHQGLKLPSPEGWSVPPRFDGDGSRIAISSGDVAQVWDTTSGHALTAPLRHQGAITSVDFSSDGLLVATSSADGTARLWQVAPASEPPAWLPDALEACSFQYLDESGTLQAYSADKFNRIRTERLASMSNDPWEVFGRWLFSDPQTRTISPWSSVTVPEYVQQLLADGTKQSLDEAASLTQGDAEVHTQIDTKRKALPQ